MAAGIEIEALEKELAGQKVAALKDLRAKCGETVEEAMSRASAGGGPALRECLR